MGDESHSSASETPTPTRRTVLALVGSAATAGCTSLPIGDQHDTTEIDGVSLRKLAARAEAMPPQTLPVAISPGYLDSAESRARELLDEVPSPLTETEIPNGVIRERVVDARENATAALKRASKAASPYQRLLELEHARGDARFVAAAWAAVGDRLTRDDVVAEASGLRQAIDDFRGRWEYVGSDPVRSVVVHETIEDRVRSATGDVENLRDGRTHQPGDVLDVGELAEEAERARTNVATAGHVYEQYSDSLDERRETNSAFSAARETLVAAVRERTRERFGTSGDQPDPTSLVERNVDGTPAASVLRDLSRDLQFADWEDESAEWVANDVLRAHEQLVRHRALDAVRRRIEAGEDFTVERVADVERARNDADAAVSAVLSGSDVSVLTRNLVPEIARRAEFADDRLADLDDTVRAARLDEIVAEYVVVATMVEATPAVSDRVGDALRSA
jgi:hypothetical protein